MANLNLNSGYCRTALTGDSQGFYIQAHLKAYIYHVSTQHTVTEVGGKVFVRGFAISASLL